MVSFRVAPVRNARFASVSSGRFVFGAHHILAVRSPSTGPLRTIRCWPIRSGATGALGSPAWVEGCLAIGRGGPADAPLPPRPPARSAKERLGPNDRVRFAPNRTRNRRSRWSQTHPGRDRRGVDFVHTPRPEVHSTTMLKSSGSGRERRVGPTRSTNDARVNDSTGSSVCAGRYQTVVMSSLPSTGRPRRGDMSPLSTRGCSASTSP